VVAPLLGLVTREKKESSSGSKMIWRLSLSSSSDEELMLWEAGGEAEADAIFAFAYACVFCLLARVHPLELLVKSLAIGDTTGVLWRLLGWHWLEVCFGAALTGECW
tara:strand:- start:212 stop:532 length:321 start_codon:yes stop_codon:yes gene_type:complete